MNHLDDQQFLSIVEHTPLVSIDLVIRNPNREVLLGYRTNQPAQHHWFVPGGRIRKDERMHDAFARLTQTELSQSFTLEQARFLGPYEHLYHDNFLGQSGVSTHYVVLGYELEISESQLCSLDDQHSEQRWWSEADLLASDQVHPNTKAYFDRAYC